MLVSLQPINSRILLRHRVPRVVSIAVVLYNPMIQIVHYLGFNFSSSVLTPRIPLTVYWSTFSVFGSVR